MNQTYEDWELIIVDDGSTDDTEEVVRSVTDDRIRYISHDTNRGVSTARNTGIEKAKGDFIAFQDSDDEWDPKKLEKQMEVFESASSEVGVVYTGLWRVFDDDQRKYIPQGDVSSKRGKVLDLLLEYNFVSTQTAVVRKECFRVVGTFDEDIPRLVDWELWIRISEEFEFELVNEPLVTAFIRNDNISKDVEALSEARVRIFEKHQNKFDTHTRAIHLFRIGHSAMRSGNKGRGRRYLLRAVRTDPRIRYLLSFLLSVFGKTIYNTIYRSAKNSRRFTRSSFG